MNKILFPQKIDKRMFNPDLQIPEVKYGLPDMVIYCKSCVISNQRPNSTVEYSHTKESIKKTINFDASGICDACNFARKKRLEIDWQEREKELIELCNIYRSRNGNYDCIVPGSGGKDSFYAAHILRTKYGMHPLTITWSPHIYTEWGWRNFQRWIHSGLDNYLMTPNGRVHRLLTRLALDNLFHPFQPFMFGQKALAPRMAIQLDIPLVFYGENESEYGNPISDTNTSLRHASYHSTNSPSDLFFGGTSISDLKRYFGLDDKDMLPYLPANKDTLFEKKIEVHYLGYYLKWHPQSCYYYSVEHGGFEASPERTPGTYSKYNSIDDRVDDFHYHTTGIKFGIGRASYDASQEIRSGDITRDEGISLVKRFDHEFPERFANEIFNYLSINPAEYPKAHKMFEEPIMNLEYYMALADTFRSPHIWKWENEMWKLRKNLT